MTEISFWAGRGVTPRWELLRQLSSLISRDLFNVIKDTLSDQESLYFFGEMGGHDAPVIWTFFADKHSWRKWFLKGKTVQRIVLRIAYSGEPRLVNGIYFIPESESVKCELFRDSPSIRNTVQNILGLLVDQLWFTGIEYIDMSCDPLAWYPGERLKLPKAKLLGH